MIDLLAFTQVQFHLHPLRGAIQWGLGLGIGVLGIESARAEVTDFGQFQWQHLLWQGVYPAICPVNYREGFAPIALAAKQPVAQPVRHGLFAQPGLRQPLRYLGNRLCLAQAVQGYLVIGGILYHSVAGPSSGLHIEVFGSGNRLDDVQVELLGESPVAFIVRRHRHNGAGPVPH